jgi:PadR family transcriptional regulator PadR
MSDKTDDGTQLRELRRGVAPYCVLSLLAERDHYGYEVARRLRDMDGLVTSEGTVYPLLGRLSDAGLVTTTWWQSDSGRPRKYYALTPAGRQALADFRREWTWFRDLVDEVLDIPN